MLEGATLMKRLTRCALVALTTTAAALGVFAAADGGEKPKVEGFTDTPMLPGGKWHVHDPNRPQPPVVAPGATFSQGAPAPSDAIVLFDGKDLSKWVGERGADAEWKIQDGYMEAT